MHDVAGIDEAETNAAADRCGDAGISELQLGVGELALIRRDGAIKLADQCGLGVELLLRDNAFLKKKLESFEINFGVFALGLILGELPHSLCKLDLKRTRIDLCEKISFVYELTFLKCNTDELTIDATANGDGVESGDRAKAIEVNGQVAALCGGNDNRHNQIACDETSPALASYSGRGSVSCLPTVS